ncbi:hypothetical protein ACLKA7_015189 [Drosophila subpalustris]
MELKKELVGNQEVGVVSPATELSQDQDLAQVSLPTVHSKELEDNLVTEIKSELEDSQEVLVVSPVTELNLVIPPVSLATAHNQALEDSPALELKAELVGTPESE